jgi:hypothetical protein
MRHPGNTPQPTRANLGKGLLAEPVPEETRAGYSRALLGMLVARIRH